MELFVFLVDFSAETYGPFFCYPIISLTFKMAFSTFPTIERIVASVLSVVYIGVICFLLFCITRRLSSDISAWSPMRKMYIQFFCSGIAFLTSYTLFFLGCATNHEYDYSVYCACTLNFTKTSLMITASYFMSSTIYAYQRLHTVLVGIK